MEGNCTNDFVFVVSFPDRIRSVEHFLHTFLSVREGQMEGCIFFRPGSAFTNTVKYD